MTRCTSFEELLTQPFDTLFITTSSLHHLELFEQVQAFPIACTVVENPLAIWLNKYAGPDGGQKVCGFIFATGTSSAMTDAVRKKWSAC